MGACPSENIRARYAIDASGRNSVIGNKFKLKKSYQHLQKLSLFAHYEGLEREAGIDGTLTRMVRTAMLEELSQDYIRTARAKGLTENQVVYRHALRNALIPVVTVLGIQFGRLLGGAVVTEAVFAYPGLGRLVVTSIQNRDYPVVQGALMLVVVIFLLTSIVVDLSYAYLDPRVTLRRGKG